jgi:crotonobetainyl-CoA hydratase
MTYRFIQVESAQHITTITINRPEVMNAIHPPTSEELGHAFDAFATDDEQWVAIVTGAGSQAFSAGNDLKVAAAGEKFDVKLSGGFGGITDRHDLWKPVIAAVNGVALGGGFEIALACDILIAADNAVFGLPEPRVGFVAAAGGMHRLPRLIPHTVAMGLLLRGKPIDAQEAYRLGLVNEVTPQAAVMDTARTWAREIMECAPVSVRLSKQAALLNLHLPLEQAMHTDVPLTKVWRDSHDLREGPLAFAEKRKPHWQGR